MKSDPSLRLIENKADFSMTVFYKKHANWEAIFLV